MPGTTVSGYASKIYMPIVSPPVNPVDASTYYNSLNLNVVATDNGADGIEFDVTNASGSVDIYAVSGGLINYVAPGGALPDGTTLPSPGSGALLLNHHIVDIHDITDRIATGVPVMQYTLYSNVDLSAARSEIELFVTNEVREEVLDDTWLQVEGTDPSVQSLIDKRAKYTDLIMTGERSVFCEGGSKIGELVATSFTLKHFHKTNGTVYGITPLEYLRDMPFFSDENNQISQRWEDHPLITSASSFVAQVDINVRFEAYNTSSEWNAQEPRYKWLDEDIDVQLIKYNPFGGTTTVLDTQQTDSLGRVNFTIASARGANLYFKVISPDVYSSNLAFPASWSTKKEGVSTDNWKSTDGSDGYLPNFRMIWGTFDDPKVYRVGVDWYYKFELYNHFSKTNKTWVQFPKGIPVGIVSLDKYDGIGAGESISETDANGEAFGVLFDVDPGDSLCTKVLFQSEDSSIQMPEITVNLDKEVVFEKIYKNFSVPVGTTKINFWLAQILPDTDTVFQKGNRQNNFPSNVETSLIVNNSSIANGLSGQFSPLTSRCTNKYRVMGAYAIKCIREFHEFLSLMTNGSAISSDVELRLYPSGGAQTATSWPKGVIKMTSEADVPGRYGRETIIHEYFHQIVWKRGQFSDYAIASNFIGTLNTGFVHSWDHYHNSTLAFSEGIPEAIATIFTGGIRRDFSKMDKGIIGFGSYSEALGPTNHYYTGTPLFLNQGYSSEGAFTLGLYCVFWDIVLENIGPSYSGQSSYFYPSLIESLSGELLSANTWLNTLTVNQKNQIVSRFDLYFWKPLLEMGYLNDWALKSTEFFVQEMILSDATDYWGRLRGIWNSLNMAVNGTYFEYPTNTPIFDLGIPTSFSVNGSTELFVIRAPIGSYPGRNDAYQPDKTDKHNNQTLGYIRFWDVTNTISIDVVIQNVDFNNPSYPTGWMSFTINVPPEPSLTPGSAKMELIYYIRTAIFVYDTKSITYY